MVVNNEARPRILVLVVEDEFLIAMDLQFLLERNGYEVRGPATSIEAALDLIKASLPAVALLDFNIRGKPVTPVAECLNQLSVPVVLSSADPKMALREDAFAPAATIRKPIDEKQMVAVLESVVEGNAR